MASLTKKIIRGKPYYYLRESKRVDGKPKIVWQQYIGTSAELVRRLQGGLPHTAVIRGFGASTACLKIAQELDLFGIVDRIVPKPKRGKAGTSVGEYHSSPLSTAASRRAARERSGTGTSRPSCLGCSESRPLS